jgi:hypothetical protein
MVRKGKALDQTIATRILDAGFDALIEYDQAGVAVGRAGELSSEFAWVRVAALALAGKGQAAAEHATAMALGDLFVAALGVEGGGVLLAVAERIVLGEAADEMAAALDRAVADAVGSKWAPWVLGGLAAGVVYLIFRSS